MTILVVEHDTNKVQGLLSRIGGFFLKVIGDEVRVDAGKKTVFTGKVAGLADFLRRAKDLRVGLGETDDFHIIYVYDAGDKGFGYALNLEAPDLSEWGYAPLMAR